MHKHKHLFVYIYDIFPQQSTRLATLIYHKKSFISLLLFRGKKKSVVDFPWIVSKLIYIFLKNKQMKSSDLKQ